MMTWRNKRFGIDIFSGLLVWHAANWAVCPAGRKMKKTWRLVRCTVFLRGWVKASFPSLRDRTNLWPLLAKITARKALNQRRDALRQKRGGGAVRGESLFLNADDASALGLAGVIADDLTPAHLVSLEEQRSRLFEMLPDELLRTVATKKLEGFQNTEIAKELGVSERTIERKLNRIRNLWALELEPENSTDSVD